MKSGKPDHDKHPERDSSTVICRMPSGLVLLAKMQYLRGYCILTAEPEVASLNALAPDLRRRFLLDMTLVGDALMEVDGVFRIDYGIAGNNLAILHAHIVPRYRSESIEMQFNHPWAYPRKVKEGTPFDPGRDAVLIQKLAKAIACRQG